MKKNLTANAPGLRVALTGLICILGISFTGKYAWAQG